jgi:hypothetical protein
LHFFGRPLNSLTKTPARAILSEPAYCDSQLLDWKNLAW